MAQQEILTEVKQLIIDSLKLDKTADQIEDAGALFGDGLGLDSIDALELALALERKYRVTIPDEKVGKQAFASAQALWVWRWACCHCSQA
jgi:acyl carrier protein